MSLGKLEAANVLDTMIDLSVPQKFRMWKIQWRRSSRKQCCVHAHACRGTVFACKVATRYIRANASLLQLSEREIT